MLIVISTWHYIFPKNYPLTDVLSPLCWVPSKWPQASWLSLLKCKGPLCLGLEGTVISQQTQASFTILYRALAAAYQPQWNAPCLVPWFDPTKTLHGNCSYPLYKQGNRGSERWSNLLQSLTQEVGREEFNQSLSEFPGNLTSSLNKVPESL